MLAWRKYIPRKMNIMNVRFGCIQPLSLRRKSFSNHMFLMKSKSGIDNRFHGSKGPVVNTMGNHVDPGFSYGNGLLL